MPSLSEVKYFLNVAKTLNVSRAAELSGISQPALSHALKRLEDELDTPLLLRGKTGVQLTRAGQRLAARSKELVERWEMLAKSVKTTDQAVSGDYSIGCHPSVAIFSLPHFLRQLLLEHPDLQISLRHAPSREIAADVIAWKTDFGLVINPPPHPDLIIRDLGTDDVTLWTNGDKVIPDALIYDPTMLQTQDILKKLETRKLRFRHRIESTNLEVMATLTEAGCGTGILPGRVARTRRSLQPYSDKAPVFRDRLCLIYRVGAHNSASGRAIVQAIMTAGI